MNDEIGPSYLLGHVDGACPIANASFDDMPKVTNKIEAIDIVRRYFADWFFSFSNKICRQSMFAFNYISEYVQIVL